MKRKDTIARIIRIVSAPPVMVSTLLIVLNICRPDIFHRTNDVILPFFMLGIVPVLAYLFHFLIPALKEKGREMQRQLAFIFSLIGYTAAFVWALLSNVSPELLTICTTYFLSVILLTFMNKVLKKRASGHACSVVGPLVFFIFFINWKLIFPCIAIAACVFWSSLYLKRHTRYDLLGGVIATLIAFTLSYSIIML